MATVYLAIQENFEREVALKIMSSSLSEDSTFSERFLREARIVSRLVHPHIVTVHDVGIQHGHHYLSMEYISGQDLKQKLPTLSGDQLFRVLHELASALDYAGRKGYVHRDVKPENIMLHDQDGRAVLMDFGIARAADSASTMTRTGTALGTPHYMSPEQARGDTIDGRSDLYSLGVLFFYMLTGKVPYEADSAVAVGIKHITAPIPPLPDEIAMYQPLIDKLMAKKPEDRYQTGYELIVDLEKFDLAPLNAWRPQQAIEYLNSDEYTPVRDSQVCSVITGSNQGISKRSYLTSTPGAIVAQQVVNPEISSSASQNNDNINSSKLPAVQNKDAITIPEEDLKERHHNLVSKPNSILLLMLLVVGLGAGGGYLFKDTLITTSAYKELASLLKLSSPNSREPATGVVQRNENNELLTDLGEKGNLAVSSDVDDVLSVGSGSDSTQSILKVSETPDMLKSTENQVIEPGDSEFEILLKRGRELAELVKKQPERTPELIALYGRILADKPGQLEAIRALAELKADVLSAASIQIDVGEITGAQQSLVKAVTWFPELENDDIYHSLNKRIKSAEKITVLLAEAEDFFSRDRLIRPVGDNAKAKFESVLALDKNNINAKRGLDRIVDRYLELAITAQNARDDKKVDALIANGLSVNPSFKPLLELKQKAKAQSSREQTIASLLMQAQIMESEQQVFGKGQTAIAHYQSVLEIDAKQIDALQAIEQAINNLFAQSKALVEKNDYEKAIKLLKNAQISLPKNKKIQAKLQSLISNRPLIDQVLLSGQPIVDTKGKMPDAINTDRVIHVAFHYQGLEQDATVFEALLFDGGRTVQLAAVPVVVVGNSGTTQFRVDRPVEGFTDGGYHLDILLAGKRVFTQAFVITHE